MKILLDTNFLITCTNQKIDFVSITNELLDEKVEFVLPIEVEKELKEISTRNGEKTNDKHSAELALQITENLDRAVLIGENDEKGTDAGIVEYAKQNKSAIIATLDKELKERIKKQSPKTRILTIRNLKNLGIV